MLKELKYMNLKKIIVVCIALMIITPSFSFAFEAEPSETSSGSFSISESENVQDVKDFTTENFDQTSDLSDLEEANLDAALQEENLESLDSEEMMTMAATTTTDPSIDPSSLTAVQSPDLGFSKDAYLTSLFSGAAVYTYPIEVPKGIAGFQPNIALTYNSQSIGGTYGWLGDGWSLNDYYILRDVNFTPNDISDDRFKLLFDGQSHDLIYSDTDGFYHTEIETYMKIQKEIGGSNQKGEYWTVTLKDGTEYRFGYTDDSELLNSVSTRDYVSKWKLDQIKDVNGNLIEYNYVKNPVAGEVGTSYLKNISYNNGFNVIEFERAERVFSSDVVLNGGYFDGNYVVEKSILSKIKILADTTPVYVYNLDYDYTSNRYSLKSVTLTGSDNLELYTSFEYSQNEMDLIFSNGTVDSSAFPPISNSTIIDLNGDGLSDFAFSYIQNNSIWVNNGDGTFTYSKYNTSQSYFYGYKKVIDLNGDGFSDLVNSSFNSMYPIAGETVRYHLLMNNGDDTFIYSNGSADATVFPPLSILGPFSQKDIAVIDLNGDGLPDFLYSKGNDYYYIWMNNGDGTFTYSNGTIDFNTAPFPRLDDDYNETIIDLNGDGLPDFVYSYSSFLLTHADQNTYYSIWMNNGDGTFTYSNGSVDYTAFPPIKLIIYDVGKDDYSSIIDLNGDGLPDFVYSKYSSGYHLVNYYIWMNNGDGTFTYSHGSVDSTAFGFPRLDINSRIKFVDLNGDGLPDFVNATHSNVNISRSNTTYQIWMNNGSIPNLLTQINHSSGATTKIDYGPSTKYNNTKEDGLPGLPTILQVVTKVETDNGMTNSQNTLSTITYDYKGGFMHIEPKGKTEFRGFREVTVTDGRSIIEHYFHQDEVKKGKEHLTITKSTTDTLYSITENNYTANTAEDIHEILLNNTSTSLYDGQITPVISKTNYEYDSYGNVITIFNEGDLSIAGDENTITFDYTYNTSNRILNKVKKETIKDSNLQKVAEAEFYYDGHSNINTPPTTGLMTQTVAWNNNGNDIVKEFTYDSFGNLISQTDGNGHITTITYDTNPIFPISFTNALDQTTLLEYNPTIGKLEKTTDPNGFETSMTYDGFGRITKVIKPGDTLNSPTIQYQYFMDGTAPEYIQISTKKQDNDYYNMWNYYDGLLRTIKTEADSDTPYQKIISETYYDNYGGVSKIIAPRKTYEPALETVNQYDSFGRLIQTTNPDGSSRQIEYSQLKTTLFDENNHKIQMDKDVFGNIIKVTEFNGNEIYETHYEYDTLDQLIKIIPNQYYDQSNITFLVENSSVTAGSLANTEQINLNLSSLGVASPINTAYKVENITFTYDSLGRQIEMDDPDLGIWTYTYTPTNKLATQTDARGIVTSYGYDALDRLILINYPNDDNVFYEYDNGTIGTLSTVNSGIVTKSYSYDSRLRVIEEAVSIEGAENAISSRGALILGEPSKVQSNTTQNEELNLQSSKSILDLNLEQPISRWNIDPSQVLEKSEFNQSLDQSSDLTFDRFGNILEMDYETNTLTEKLSTFNQTNSLKEVEFEKQSKSINEMEPEIISLSSSSSGIRSGTTISDSFSNQQDITLQLEMSDYRVQELDLTNLRVSMGAGDVGYIHLNDREILRFVDSGSGGILYIFDENGTLLGGIQKINGKPTAENMTFDVSFTHDGTEMNIEIQKYRNGVLNDTFNYFYPTDSEITTLRAYMTGYQSGVEYISSEYTVYYEPLPPSTVITFENEEHKVIPFYQKEMDLTELHFTNLRVATGAHDVGYVYLNDLEFLRFIDTQSGGMLVVFDGDGNELDTIQQANGRTDCENVTFDVSFVRLDESNLSIELKKKENGSLVDVYSYVCSFENSILYTQMYLYGYESNVNYISGGCDTVYVPSFELTSGSFSNEEDITIPFEKEGFYVEELKLNDLRASMGASDISYIYLNNHNILKFVDSSSGGILYIYDENGTVLGTIAPVNGNPSYENRTFDVSFISIDSDVTIKIERFWKGAPNGTYYYSYQTDEQIESMRAYIYGYQSLVNYINCSYDVDYGVVIHDLPIYDISENSFENEGDITIYMENIENMTVRQIELTDLRMQSNVTENAYVSINDENILRFENTQSAKSLVILDSSGNEIDVITPLNTSSSYENVSLNVTFAFDDSNMSIQIETNEKGTIMDSYQYSYSSNDPISSLRAYVDNYESGNSFVSSSYDIYYGEVNPTNDPPEGSSTFITTYSYDSMDRVVQKTLPNGKVISYNYNDQTLLSSIPGVIDNIEYNSMNLMTRKEFSNNIATDLTYDGWTKRLEHISTLGLQDIDYLFDPKGNVLGITDNIINENQYFFYDDLDRLILAGSENYSQSFAYNPLGSILAHRNKDVVTNEEVIFGFEYGNNAGIHAPTRVDDTSLLYDANGNLIEDGSFVYVYNDANRLTEVLKKADNNRSIAQFVYDSSGSRIKKTEEGIVSYYISADYGIDDGEETVYYFANDNRIAKENSEGIFWYLDDHLGSTNVMIDESGQLVERTLYYPFGNHREGGTEKYTFTGKEFDSEIGLYYFEARYYNPETFVFTQADSILPNIYNPQELNRYAYCSNNPINFIDPTGHWAIDVHFYETYKWAREADFTRREAFIIAKANNGVDLARATFPKEINVSGLSIGDKSWHINTNGVGEIDSRQAHADQKLNDAINLWNQADTNYNNARDAFNPHDLSSYLTLGMATYQRNADRELALTYLGQSLHPLIDIESHGNIIGPEHTSQFDSRGYDWADESRTSVIKSNDQQRLNDAKEKTNNFFNIFKANTGRN